MVESRHHPTNNAILIAKLKLGFHVAGLELSVDWGTLVQLERPLTDAYRELLAYRCGASALSRELADAAGLRPIRDSS